MTKGTFASDEEESPREYGLWWGVVTNNKDPENRGRIRARIPGMNNVESTWAEPLSNPGAGGKKRGTKATPKVGATVAVMFVQGDIDEPVFFPGPPPIGQVPEGGENPDNVVVQTDNYRLLIDETPNATRFRIESSLPHIDAAKREDVKTFIEISINAGDAHKSHVVRIHAPTAIVLTSDGAISLDAPSVQIKGRSVDPSNRNI